MDAHAADLKLSLTQLAPLDHVVLLVLGPGTPDLVLGGRSRYTAKMVHETAILTALLVAKG